MNISKLNYKLNNNLKKKRHQAFEYFLARPFATTIVFLIHVWAICGFIVYEFEAGLAGANINSYGDSLWWGIVTMLTVGYGDKYPISPAGRIWAGLMMICGVAGTGIVTAKISSVFLEKALRDRRGFVDSDTLKDHFIICGWKNEMHILLNHILDSNESMKPEEIILVNNVSEEAIQTLHEFPKLKKIKLIKGDFFTVDVLKRAAPEKARKILILADATPNSAGHIPTVTEADARTVMTAMTLSNIAKGTSVAAEILDAEMDQYLKLAHVHEIIYSRDYSRLLLALSSTGTGVTNIFHDLIDPRSPYSLATKEIPPEAFRQTYSKMREIFQRKNPELTVIGILENSGNSHLAKENALRKAQLTPNIRELVDNLQNVKNLRFNQPVFAPQDSYQVAEGSMVIVIQTRGSNA